jgi:hypothetical protein
MTDERAQADTTPPDILVPVPVGELVDKITILEIKSERMTDAAQLANVRRELVALRAAAGSIACDAQVLRWHTAELKRVNEMLWDIEDSIRACEAQGDFGERFVALARAVYRNNDERARLKRAINLAAGSRFVEEKSYAAYAPRGESN